jgi:hypothetical protein
MRRSGLDEEEGSERGKPSMKNGSEEISSSFSRENDKVICGAHRVDAWRAANPEDAITISPGGNPAFSLITKI